jgi:hypothetical protein
MNAKYHTRITRKDLMNQCLKIEVVEWQRDDSVHETPETYYLPAVELLQSIIKTNEE